MVESVSRLVALRLLLHWWSGSPRLSVRARVLGLARLCARPITVRTGAVRIRAPRHSHRRSVRYVHGFEQTIGAVAFSVPTTLSWWSPACSAASQVERCAA
jgi:hypothetical protein